MPPSHKNWTIVAEGEEGPVVRSSLAVSVPDPVRWRERERERWGEREGEVERERERWREREWEKWRERER